MTLWVVELNDTAVRVTRDGELVDVSPGVVLLDGREILTGTAAAARQHLHPRAAYNRFWQQLSEAPLPGANRQCRHHADLAYHHLAAILARCQQPTEAIFAVPAHYDEAQLGLLLGICGALKLRVAGLVDSAVAAVAGIADAGEYVVADLHQHHAALVDVAVNADGIAARRRVRIIDSAGLARIESAAIDLIADAFLEQARFDPLHEAVTEQLLYTNLGEWMAQARGRSELEIAIDYHGSRFSARVDTRELERISAMVLAPVAEAVAHGPPVLLFAALAALPGAANLLADAEALPPTACASAIAEQRLALHSDSNAVPYLTELPTTASPRVLARPATAAVTRLPTAAASHILHHGHAVAAGSEALVLGDDGSISRSGAGAGVRIDDSQLMLHPNGTRVHVNGELAAAPRVLHAGDVVVVGDNGASYTAISVASYGAT